MSVIKIEETDKKLRVFFAYELKENFKKTFKSAKWNGINKCWEVNLTAKKKVIQWTEAAKEFSEQNQILKEEEDRVELEEYKLNLLVFNLKEEIKLLEKRKVQLEEKKEKLIMSREIAATLKEIISKKSKELKEEELHRADTMKHIREEIDKIINLNKILDSQNMMKVFHRKVGTEARHKFEEQQLRIKEEVNKLDSVGLQSSGLDELYAISFNRPDRDHVDDVTVEDIYTITKI